MRIEVETAAEPLTLDRLAVHFTGYPFEERGRFDAGRRDARAPLGGRLAHRPLLRARDLRGLPLLRAAAVRRRHAHPGAHLLRRGRRRPPRAPGHRQLRALAPLRGDHLQPLPRARRSSSSRRSRCCGWAWSTTTGRGGTTPPSSGASSPARGRCSTGSRERLRPDGLLGRVPWWNFVDWCDEFEAGVPPQDADGGSVPVSLQLALALCARRRTSKPPSASPSGPPVTASTPTRSSTAVRGRAWDAARGLVADTPARKRFSQQSNILALLAGAVPAGQEKPVLDRLLAMPRPSIKAAGSPTSASRRRSRAPASTSASTWPACWRSWARASATCPSSSRGARCSTWASARSRRSPTRARAPTATRGARTRTTTCCARWRA